MKYQIVINHAGIVSAGLQTKTDLVDWAILGHIYGWQANSWAERLADGKVWIDYQSIMDELPAAGLSMATISRRFKKLRELGLITTKRTQGGRIFAATTIKYQQINEGASL